MSEKSQDTDAGSVAAPSMSSDEIDAALKELTAAVEAQTGEPVAVESDNTPTEPAPEPVPATEAPPEDGPAEVQASDENTAPPVDADAEAALNRIDQDLADLESLLAETTTDGTSETASRMAASQEAAKVLAEAERLEAEARENAEDSDGATEVDELKLPPDSGLLEDAPTDETQQELSDEAAAEPTEEASPPTAESPPAPAEAAPPPPRAVPVPEVPLTLQARIAHVAASIIAAPFVFMDVPFAKLSPGFKTLLGIVGIATFTVAVATWVFGSLR